MKKKVLSSLYGKFEIKQGNRMCRKPLLNKYELMEVKELMKQEQHFRIKHLKHYKQLSNADVQDITKYINESIERQKEDWEESCFEEWTDNTLYIPIFSIGYYALNPSQKYNKYLDDYYRALNGEIIRQMVERGYKYSVCDEDIEFWK